jgi:uncharacterized protein YeaO (DUF488 family)
MSFQVKRIYEPAERSDGIRILVDRLWPRGVSRQKAQLDHWMKDIAPTPKLRTWFNHRPDRFVEFRKRYKQELAANPALAELRKLGARRRVTLLYGARDPEVNHAIVLQATLKR